MNMFGKLVLGCLITLLMVGCFSEYIVQPTFKSPVIGLDGKCLNLPSKDKISTYQSKDQLTYFYLLQYANARGIEISEDCSNMVVAERYQKPVGAFTGNFSKISIKIGNKLVYETGLETSMDFNQYDYARYTEIMFNALVKDNGL